MSLAIAGLLVSLTLALGLVVAAARLRAGYRDRIDRALATCVLAGVVTLAWMLSAVVLLEAGAADGPATLSGLAVPVVLAVVAGRSRHIAA